MKKVVALTISRLKGQSRVLPIPSSFLMFLRPKVKTLIAQTNLVSDYSIYPPPLSLGVQSVPVGIPIQFLTSHISFNSTDHALSYRGNGQVVATTLFCLDPGHKTDVQDAHSSSCTGIVLK